MLELVCDMSRAADERTKAFVCENRREKRKKKIRLTEDRPVHDVGIAEPNFDGMRSVFYLFYYERNNGIHEDDVTVLMQSYLESE